MDWRKATRYLLNALPSREAEVFQQDLMHDQKGMKELKSILSSKKSRSLLSEEEKDKAWQEIQVQAQKGSFGSRKWIYWSTGIAASLTLLVGAFFYHQDEVLTTSWNQRSQVDLSDGSEVFLNSESRLQYPETFGVVREVNLLGEAFFQIQPESRPFVIKTLDSEVRVLGTSFNVLSRKSSNQVEVSVVTGVVSLSSRGQEIKLNKGEKGVYQVDTGELMKLKEREVNDLAWYDQKLTFSDTRFTEVVQQLESSFRISVKLEEPTILDCSLTAEIEFDSLHEVLEILSLTMGFDYLLNGNEVVLKGGGCE